MLGSIARHATRQLQNGWAGEEGEGESHLSLSGLSRHG